MRYVSNYLNEIISCRGSKQERSFHLQGVSSFQERASALNSYLQGVSLFQGINMLRHGLGVIWNDKHQRKCRNFLLIYHTNEIAYGNTTDTPSAELSYS